MSVIEIKSEIEKELDKVPEKVLLEVLSYLKQAESNPELDFKKHLEIILIKQSDILVMEVFYHLL